MEYKILGRRQDITITTKVQYTFGEKVVIVDVPHFNPSSEDDIILGIENRAISEEYNLKNQDSEVKEDGNLLL